MRVVKPDMHLTDTEKMLIKILAQKLVDDEERSLRLTNMSSQEVSISDEDAYILIDLINAVINRMEFKQITQFMERVLSSEENDPLSREIYLSNKKKRGRSRAHASNHWADFRVRLGLYQSWYPGSRSSPMTKEHFLKMEESLFYNAGLNEKAIPVLMQVVATEWDAFEKLRENKEGLPAKSAEQSLKNLSEQIKEGVVNKINIGAAVTLVANGAVMFTTRDWGVTGTISSIIGTSSSLVKRT